MGLNILAHRKLSLAGFSDDPGWDKCYLKVKVASPQVMKEWQGEMAAFLPGQEQKEAVQDTDVNEVIRNAALEVIVGGEIMNTDDDGNVERLVLSAADIPAVVDAIGFAWQQEAVATSTGANRLKAQN